MNKTSKGSAKFKTTVLGTRGNTTGLEVPAEVMAALGPQKRPRVKVTLSGYTYQSTIGVMGGRSLIPLSSAHREAAGVKAGDTVDVSIELDMAPQVTEIPTDLLVALSKAGVKGTFDALAPSRRKEFVRQVVEAKAQETRERRIAKIVSELSRTGRAE